MRNARGSSPLLPTTSPPRRSRARSISSRATARLRSSPSARRRPDGASSPSAWVSSSTNSRSLSMGRYRMPAELMKRWSANSDTVSASTSAFESSIAGRESMEARSWATPSRASSSVRAEAAHPNVSRNARILAVKSRDGSRNSTCSSPRARAGAIHASGYGCEGTAGGSGRPGGPGGARRGGTGRLPAGGPPHVLGQPRELRRVLSLHRGQCTPLGAQPLLLGPLLGSACRRSQRGDGAASRDVEVMLLAVVAGQPLEGRERLVSGARRVGLGELREAARERVERDRIRAIHRLGRDQRILFGGEGAPELGGSGRQLLHLRPILPSNRRPALRQQAMDRGSVVQGAAVPCLGVGRLEQRSRPTEIEVTYERIAGGGGGQEARQGDHVSRLRRSLL